jgi:hypothetical protein
MNEIDIVDRLRQFANSIPAVNAGTDESGNVIPGLSYEAELALRAAEVIGELRDQLAVATATVEQCKAAGFITADGVIALPGTFVYAKWWNGNVARGFVRHETHGSESCCFVEMTTTTEDGRTIGVRTFLSDCYSTRTAAEAALYGEVKKENNATE